MNLMMYLLYFVRVTHYGNVGVFIVYSHLDFVINSEDNFVPRFMAHPTKYEETLCHQFTRWVRPSSEKVMSIISVMGWELF